ncbi:MAG TPA: energy transducer TonB [Candidatus Acidoferrales bacterium]|nr:energy transducer TonB [Candidatus Acidoferrales bacterium]
MARGNRVFQLAALGALMAVFAIPPQLVHAQNPPEVKRKVKTQLNPVYPELARRLNVHGRVRLQVTVEPDGSVKAVHVLGGHPVLVGVSQEAVKQWKFEPGPKETTQIIEFNFE